MEGTALEARCINTLRLLAADAVQQANSGHPGMPMGAAPMAFMLWANFLRHNPRDPHWPNRDRFVLSAGHGCMLQYALLHLTGYDVTMEDLKSFRQLGSITAGHPEYGLTPGVEVTTGPLGQGFANGIGFAIAQQHLAARYNRPGFDLFDYRVYAICSDGDLMEGISSEAASLAGHLHLGNLIYLYDDNQISIEGSTDLAFTEDVTMRFEAFGWQVLLVENGNDLDQIREALLAAEQDTQRPTLIRVRTQIGYGSPNKVNTAAAHGSPLGADEVARTKQQLGWDPDKHFFVPNQVAKFFRQAVVEGEQRQHAWQQQWEAYQQAHPDLAAEYERLRQGELTAGWENQLPTFEASVSGMATRKASGQTLNAVAADFPLLMGGSADLEPSTNTYLKGLGEFTATDRSGRNMRFGVREHAMGAILNGMALTPGFRPYGATFLIFSEYMRPAIRLAAIMKINPIYVFTHDSIGLGEDGTTHQPIEQLAALRAIPNLLVLRPADANETAQAWRVALQHRGGPIALVLTRQNLPVLDRTDMAPAAELARGAYVLREAEGGAPEGILIATGSEVALALAAQAALQQDGIRVRVVSMPSQELFAAQPRDYRQSVLPPALRKRVTVEAGTTFGWHRYATDEGVAVGIDQFGESGPYEALMAHFGFTVENLYAQMKRVLQATAAE